MIPDAHNPGSCPYLTEHGALCQASSGFVHGNSRHICTCCHCILPEGLFQSTNGFHGASSASTFIPFSWASFTIPADQSRFHSRWGYLQNRYSIWIFFNRFFHLMNVHFKESSQISVYFRIYINRNCPVKYQGIDGTFMYISRQNDLISCFAD